MPRTGADWFCGLVLRGKQRKKWRYEGVFHESLEGKASECEELTEALTQLEEGR